MKYNSATDRHESEFLEPILDTNFKYGVPYKINREIYENAFKKFNKNSSIKHAIKHADVVVFHAHYDEDYSSYTFFAFPKNSPEDYDCAQFYDYDDKHKESFENFTHFVDAVLESVISADKQYGEKLIAELKQEIDTKMKDIELLKNLL